MKNMSPEKLLIMDFGKLNKKKDFMKIILKIFLTILVFICIFDPQDRLFNLKVPIFVAIFFLFLIVLFTRSRRDILPKGMAIYILVFSFIIPSLSILYLFISGNYYSSGHEIFSYFKPYLFLTLTFILCLEKEDLIKEIVYTLTFLSLAIIAITILVKLNFKVEMLSSFGQEYVIYGINKTLYGGFELPKIYFHTSPLIVISTTYFSYHFIKSKKARLKKFFLLIISVSAMFLSGSRGNMFMSIISCLTVFYLFSNINKKIIILIVFLSVILWIALSTEIFSGMFSVDDISNYVRLSFFNDYMTLFKNAKILFFGQGLGSSFYSTFRGHVSVSELTYFEIIRRFGLFLAFIYFILMAYPLKMLKYRQSSYYWLFLAYAFYLIMSFTDTLIFSSNGMIFLSIVLNKVFNSIPGKGQEVSLARYPFQEPKSTR
jgi:hypothetical protein